MTPPPGVELGPVSAEVFEILARYTVFPWPVLKSQAVRQKLDPEKLRLEDLPRVIDSLARGVERFTSPSVGVAVRRDLEALLHGGHGST